MYIYQNKYMALLSRAMLAKKLLLLLFLGVLFQLVYYAYIKFSIINVSKVKKVMSRWARKAKNFFNVMKGHLPSLMVKHILKM